MGPAVTGAKTEQSNSQTAFRMDNRTIRRLAEGRASDGCRQDSYDKYVLIINSLIGWGKLEATAFPRGRRWVGLLRLWGLGLRAGASALLLLFSRGRDTGDAQIYFNLVDNFRLDRDYTVVATMRDGLSVMDRIEEGDVIERIEIIRVRSGVERNQ